MARTNFTKAEEAMANAMQKLSVEKLLELADKTTPTIEGVDKSQARAYVLRTLKRDLKVLRQTFRPMYEDLKITSKTIKLITGDPASISLEDWKLIIDIKTKVDPLIAGFAPALPSTEEQIEQERKKHITKRFNVNDKWLPLK